MLSLHLSAGSQKCRAFATHRGLYDHTRIPVKVFTGKTVLPTECFFFLLLLEGS